jgi:hypothetical protein
MLTTTFCDVWLVPDAFDTVRPTVYVPAVRYMCDGFWNEEPCPSPKSHVEVVGPPEEVSVKLMVWSGSGDGGEKLKEAVGAATFVTVTECET